MIYLEKNILKILEAARWAPSCGNSQPWHFIVVKDKSRISELVKATYFAHFPFINPLPPLIIAFVLNNTCAENEHVCTDVAGRNCTDAQLCLSMSVMNAILEAEDLGIQSAILTPRKKSIQKILKVRNGKEIPLIVGIGYEKKESFTKKRVRKKNYANLYMRIKN